MVVQVALPAGVRACVLYRPVGVCASLVGGVVSVRVCVWFTCDHTDSHSSSSSTTPVRDGLLDATGGARLCINTCTLS